MLPLFELPPKWRHGDWAATIGRSRRVERRPRNGPAGMVITTSLACCPPRQPVMSCR
ncbi:hypothetical protein B0T14DRAFT_311500 [Immersiella caudata]|uniref:Uncharacterized protein n=1 Tax=Immersiella caudata TaxID=314043 RepID=A0AA39WFT4_9PEZI|nr:hypothetical protein B0T14DRAFT_311500 [Immersiella caudata]